MTIDAIINHLWQSTWCAVAAMGVAFMLRRNQPRVRYWVWLGASLKFLVPFAALVGVGRWIPWQPMGRVSSVLAPVLPDAATFIAQPFPQTQYVPVSTGSSVAWVPLVLAVMWAIGLVTIAWERGRRWLAIRAAMRAGTPLALPIPLPALITPGVMGPGVVGFVRPVLVLPTQLLERFTPRQLEAVLAHEWCHVRRRDNVFAAMHMMVEATVWFHPVVWWLGARILEERELACDEDVVASGCEPTDYVQGILTVCRFHTESALACVAGVTGADLKKRVEAILAGRTTRELSVAKKVALTLSALATVAVPIGVGVFDSSLVHAQSQMVVAEGRSRPAFEVSSVKPIDRALMTRNHEGNRLTPTIFIDRTELMAFIVRAYVRGGGCAMKVALGIDCPFIVGTLPAWVKTERWEIQGTLPGQTPVYSARQVRENETTQVNLMLQVLLEDRFRLQVHRESRELPVYALVVGKNGPKLSPPTLRVIKENDGTPREIHGMASMLAVRTADGTRRSRMQFRSSSMQEAAEALAPFFDRPVVDRTGLTGDYDFILEYEVDSSAPSPPSTPSTSGRGGNYFNPLTGLTASELSNALQEIGLKLDSTKARLDVLVVDHVEKPIGN